MQEEFAASVAEQPKPTLIELEQQALTVKSGMSAIKIVDQSSYDQAVTARKQAATFIKEAADFFDGNINDAHNLHKKLLAQKKSVVGPVEDTMRMINSELVRFDNEQERLRREEQRRLDEEARKQAEDQAIEDAIHAESQGVPSDQAAVILDAPIAVTAPVAAAPTYERSAAVTYRDNWGGEVIDLNAVIKAAGEGNATAASLLMINQPALTQMARAMKETLANAVPGVRAVNNKVVATGRG